MRATKYHAIDKSIIQDEAIFEFNIYIASDSKKKMQVFKENGKAITNDEKKIIDSQNLLYVQDTEYIAYEHFKQNISPILISKKNLSFNEKSNSIYNNASDILNNLFSNPEALGNYEASKEVVNNMVEIILDNDFTISSLMSLATHDYYTHTHSINVAIYSLSLGAFLRLSTQELSELGESALLHDLGKSKVDANIINKNGKLTDEEFQEIKKHPALGYRLGVKLGIKNKKVLDGIRHHHEKMDGTGYPFGFKGEEIPYNARIIGICDIFDALTSRRSYKEPMSSFEALLLIKTSMKNELDTNLLDKMIEMFR